MKRVICRLILLCLMDISQVLYGQDSEDWSGEVIFDDGTSVTFHELWSTAFGYSIPFTKNIEDVKNEGLRPLQIELSSISRIDFLKFTHAENTITKAATSEWSGLRKVRITFQDGEVYDPAFMSTASMEWKGPRLSGNFSIAPIKAATFTLNTVKAGYINVYIYIYKISEWSKKYHWDKDRILNSRISVFQNGTTNLVLSTEFDESVNLPFPLPPGVYDVRFECSGWTTILKRAVMVVEEKTSTVNFYAKEGEGLSLIDYSSSDSN